MSAGRPDARISGPGRLVLGSRGSELALAQTGMVQAALRQRWPDLAVEIKMIRTQGDETAGAPRAPVDIHAGRKGLFTGEIERALLDQEIDVAVHSAKDLPSETSPGLEIGAVLPRAPVEDILVSKVKKNLAWVASDTDALQSLSPNAVVATGSVRRQRQLRWQRPDLRPTALRGNVPTRLRKLAENEWEAIILARAGLERLGYEVAKGIFVFENNLSFHAGVLPLDGFLPAGGQGIIALQMRQEDSRRALLDGINDAETLLCLQAEREFLRLLQGDCQSPVGVMATLEAGKMRLRAQVFVEDQPAPRTGEVQGAATDTDSPNRLAAELFRRIHER